MKKFFVLAVSALALFLNGCAKKTPAPTQPAQPATVKEAPAPRVQVRPEPMPGKLVNAIAAVVNDDIITLYEIKRETKALTKDREKVAPLDEAARKQMPETALNLLIEKSLIRQKIKELNVKVSDDEVRQSIEDVKRQNNLSQAALVAALSSQGITYEQYFSQLRDQLEKLKLVSMEVRSKIHVSDSEIKEYYEANPDQFSEEEEFKARHIFFRVNEAAPDADIKKAMQTALHVLAEAQSGKDFIELAKQYSEDPAARKDGGDLGRFKKGDMQPELERAIINLKPGQISELVYTPLGLHIIKLEERMKGKLKPLETVKTALMDTLYRKKSEERFNRWAKELRSRSSIDIKELKGYL